LRDSELSAEERSKGVILANGNCTSQSSEELELEKICLRTGKEDEVIESAALNGCSIGLESEGFKDRKLELMLLL
jgi:hypothetical protein